MDLYLVRHTRVGVTTGLCYGHMDVPVAESFVDEASLVKGRLASLGAAVVVSSPLQRCALLARSLSTHVDLDPDLRELHFGEWEGRLWSEIPRPEIDRWAAQFATEGPPGGEAYTALRERLERALARIHARGASQVICVTHGGPIRVLLCMALGLGAEKAFQFAIDYGSVTWIRWPLEGPRSVGYVNRTSDPEEVKE